MKEIMKEIKSIRDINFKGRKVLLRADFNVPETEGGVITDDTRIRESLPTIEKLLADGAAIIIMWVEYAIERDKVYQHRADDVFWEPIKKNLVWLRWQSIYRNFLIMKLFLLKNYWAKK